MSIYIYVCVSDYIEYIFDSEKNVPLRSNVPIDLCMVYIILRKLSKKQIQCVFNGIVGRKKGIKKGSLLDCLVSC